MTDRAGPYVSAAFVLLACGRGQVMVCEGHRVDPAPMTSPFWAQAAARYRSLVTLEHGTGPLLGEAYLNAAGPAAWGTRFIDWPDLLWNGVGRPHDVPPNQLDPATLYVLAPEFVAPLAAKMDPARGTNSAWWMASPCWRRDGGSVPACNASSQ